MDDFESGESSFVRVSDEQTNAYDGKSWDAYPNSNTLTGSLHGLNQVSIYQ